MPYHGRKSNWTRQLTFAGTLLIVCAESNGELPHIYKIYRKPNRAREIVIGEDKLQRGADVSWDKLVHEVTDLYRCTASKVIF